MNKSKIIDMLETYQASPSLIPTRPRLSTSTQYMSVSHGHSTIGGIDGGCGEDKKKATVSHQLRVSTGYGDAH